MAYLKPDSILAQQELNMKKACQIIAKKAKEHSVTHRKSYVIDSKLFGDDEAVELNSPFNRPFGRG